MMHQSGNGTVRIFSARACTEPLEKGAKLFEEQTAVQIEIKEEGVPSQGWYAKQAFAFLATGFVALVVYFILKRYIRAETNLKPALTRMLGVLVTLIVIICMGYMMYYEFNKWRVFASMGWQ